MRIKPTDELAFDIPIKLPHQYFSNLFNAYTKSINKKYGQHGSLFERAFHRKCIGDEKYLKTAVLYVNTNAVKHGFVKRNKKVELEFI